MAVNVYKSGMLQTEFFRDISNTTNFKPYQKIFVVFSMPHTVSIFWFRRDLRLSDNAGLYYALRQGLPVLPIFVFDTAILNDLKNKEDKRVDFIHRSLQQLHQELVAMGSGLYVHHGTVMECYQQLLQQYNIASVYTNHDYEPYAIQRDKEVSLMLSSYNIALHTYKDQVIFDKNEVVKDSGDPYTVYTPYSKRWKEKLNDFYLKPYPTEKYFGNFLKYEALPIPALESIGFRTTALHVLPPVLDEQVAADYDKTRDYPAVNGTTKLSVHLRFGTVSIRQLASQAMKLNMKLLNELIWRDFYQCILWHFPHVVGQSFKKEYDNIVWRNNEQEFEAWCNGHTGYAIVDAGMRELNATGYMHNRVRMITASFLTKDLLVDWRRGEAYFAEKLLDFDLASNNGGWQWAAGTGCDAAPYFRIFNPALQTEKFDPNHEYIKKWVPEYQSLTYRPIVDHNEARDRCLRAYKVAL